MLLLYGDAASCLSFKTKQKLIESTVTSDCSRSDSPPVCACVRACVPQVRRHLLPPAADGGHPPDLRRGGHQGQHHQALGPGRHRHRLLRLKRLGLEHTGRKEGSGDVALLRPLTPSLLHTPRPSFARCYLKCLAATLSPGRPIPPAGPSAVPGRQARKKDGDYPTLA